MSTVANDLDLIQARLHDDGALWSRTELLRWYNWAIAELIDRSQCLRRIHLIDLPARFSGTFSYEWEDRYVTGPSWMCLLPCMDTTRRGTYLWEAEQVEGVTASSAFNGLTQQWERDYLGDTDRYYEFALPKLTDVIYRVAWNGKWLGPVSVREFDNVTDRWMRAIGEPRWWTPGTGRIKTLQVYEIQTTYIQNYRHWEFEDYGFARFFSGDRTYTVSSSITDNAWAYTSSGDSDSFTVPTSTFLNPWAYTQTWESAYAPGGYNFTINYTMNLAGQTMTYVHPWEGFKVGGPMIPVDSSTPGKRGMFSWEAHFGGVGTVTTAGPLPTNTGHPVLPSGMGWRFTQAATDTSRSFVTQPWEAQVVQGATSFPAGGTVGTYGWEAIFGAPTLEFGVGTIRSMVSPDRQYWGVQSGIDTYGLCGGLRDLRSSENALQVWHSVAQEVDLVESDTPDLIPAPMQKYCRYFALAKAYGRPGEGQQLALSLHYTERYDRGVKVLKKLTDQANKDRVWRRQDDSGFRGRTPLVRLPSNFERTF